MVVTSGSKPDLYWWSRWEVFSWLLVWRSSVRDLFQGAGLLDLQPAAKLDDRGSFKKCGDVALKNGHLQRIGLQFSVADAAQDGIGCGHRRALWNRADKQSVSVFGCFLPDWARIGWAA